MYPELGQWTITRIKILRRLVSLFVCGFAKIITMNNDLKKYKASLVSYMDRR
jgi:hypothetical protein